jgi:hypothetical protein
LCAQGALLPKKSTLSLVGETAPEIRVVSFISSRSQAHIS